MSEHARTHAYACIRI